MSVGVLTIGRGLDNDLSLPDPDRMLSKRHCVLEARDDALFLVDVSTNGTYLNYCNERVGEAPTPLSDGDVIQLGDYELVVEIAQPCIEASLLPPLDEIAPAAAHAPAAVQSATALDDLCDDGDDFLDALLGGSPGRDVSVASVLGSGGSGDLVSAIVTTPAPGPSLPDHSPAAHDHFAGHAQTRPLIPEDWDDLDGKCNQADPSHTTQGTEPSPPSTVPTPALRDALAAFLNAAGVGHLIVPEVEQTETMARLGRVFASMTAGIREILLARASFKSELRVERTMVSVGGNNPLKFSINPEQAVEAMIRPTVPGYQDAETAMSEALNDIKAHEVAMMVGLEAALKDVLARLDPARISECADSGSSIGGLEKGSKARRWDQFERAHARITKETESNFESDFGQAFTRSYQAQLERLKSQ
ncbi:MAG: type VI secretion system-associated FHA domain protein TagH [Pseudomonadota bacterium]